MPEGYDVRELSTADARAMADAYRRNRRHLEPWEPYRPEIFYTEDGQRYGIEQQLAMAASGLMVAWAIWHEGRVVGRVSAQVDHAYNEHHGERWGWFGFLEFEDDAEILDALLAAAERWVRERGMERMVGPADFAVNDESGIVFDGYDLVIDGVVLPGMVVTISAESPEAKAAAAATANAATAARFTAAGLLTPEPTSRSGPTRCVSVPRMPSL